MDFGKVKRVLIYRLGSLGDTVVALPAFHLIRQAFPIAHRVLLTNTKILMNAPAALTVLDGSGLIHDVIDYSIGMRSFTDIARLWWKIVRFRPQVIVYLMEPRPGLSVLRDLWFFRLVGAPLLVGFPRSEDLARPQFDPVTGLWEKEASRVLRCLSVLGDIDIDSPSSWDLHLTSRELQSANRMLGPLEGIPLIACGPATKMQSKDWGLDNWCALLDRLAQHLPRHALVMVGSEHDIPAAEDVGRAWTGPVLNLCGRLTPRETAAVLQHAELFLGPDSGPMHLAAACGIPCAIPFSARQNPGIWFPVGRDHRIVYHSVACRGCLLETCIENRKICLTSITVDEMFTAAMEAWKNGQRAQDSGLA
jgi:ADP-heptose:LPS heptosyltransferase